MKKLYATAAAACGILLVPLAVAGCSSTGPDDDASATEPESEASTVEDDSEASTDESEPPDPVEAFRTWLEASREPDPDAACLMMSDELVEQSIAEMEAEGWPEIGSCEELIEVTAALYEAAGYSTGATVEVIEETDTGAELFVTYHDSGNCGTVVMARQQGMWMITEQSEECGG